MAGRLAWCRLQAARTLGNRPVILQQTRRGAHQDGGATAGRTNTWLVAAAAGASLIAAYQVVLVLAADGAVDGVCVSTVRVVYRCTVQTELPSR